MASHRHLLFGQHACNQALRQGQLVALFSPNGVFLATWNLSRLTGTPSPGHQGRGYPPKMEERILKELDGSDEQAQIAAIQAPVFLGTVDNRRNELAKFANDPSHSAQTRRLAQDVLDVKARSV
jgi:hypothetical protein